MDLNFAKLSVDLFLVDSGVLILNRVRGKELRYVPSRVSARRALKTRIEPRETL